jgi:excisionase family DNA binding protein
VLFPLSLWLIAATAGAPSNRRERRHPDESPARRWATTQQTAEHLGVTTRFIRKMTATGRLRRYTLGGVIRYDLAEVDDALIPGGDA